MKISARVVTEVTRDRESGRYLVNVGGREYEIVSKGRQAIRDYLFIRKGQSVEIEGKIEGFSICPEKCRISLRENRPQDATEDGEDENTEGTARGGAELPEGRSGEL